jgi:hypothetical protein
MQPFPTSRDASSPAAHGSRRPWEAPRVEDLPRLIRLTLQSIPGGGGTGGGGSTVVP